MKSAPWFRASSPNTLSSTTIAMAALVALPLALLSAQSAPLAAGINPLTYSRGFLITGNYIAAGMRSSAGHIQITGIKNDSDIVGAYLFFETIHSASDPHPEDMARFANQALPKENLQARSFSLTGNTATCWGAASKISQPMLTMYRADVLPLLRKRMDKDNNWTGKYHVNDFYFVVVPDGFNGNNAVQSGGATLVIVYKDMAEPLRKITFFDGVYPKLETTDLNQTLAGFYKSAGTLSRMTHLVGAGGSNTSDRLYFNSGGQDVAIAADPFTVRSGSGRTWNTVTVNLGTGPLANATRMPGRVETNPANPASELGEFVTTRVSHTSTKRECLAWGAIIFSTQVADNDPTLTGGRLGDGLPDGLEDAPNGLKDPNGVQLPNLNAMGASSAYQDLFVELNAMWTTPDTRGDSDPANDVSTGPITYGTHQYATTDPDGHSHILSPPNIAELGAMYGGRGIRAHFDVGDPQIYRDRYVLECDKTRELAQCQDEADAADQYLIARELARGGEMIQEKACSNPDLTKCQFGAWPGTIGWPLGAQLLRDAPVGDAGEELAVTNADGTPHADLINWANGTEQRRRFDLERRDYFRLLLSGHGRGKARSQFPCLDVSDPLNPVPADYNSAHSCAAPLIANPDFSNIRSLSGIAHLGGNFALKTLGLWDDFTGTEFVQGSTAAHELGHTFYLWHGGLPAIFGDSTANPPTPSVIEPNCKPNYLSSMSYSVQAIGLLDNSGNAYFDYSGERHADINENALLNGALTPGTNLYRPAWFVPLVEVSPGGPLFNPLAASQGAPPATRFCSGQRFDPSAPPQPRARVEANLISDAIEWDGDVQADITSSDVNFDGALTTLKGFNDWANLRLDQIGGGREFTLVGSVSSSGGIELTVDAGSGGELVLEAAGGGELAVDLGSGIELTVDAGSGGELLAELGGGGELVVEAGGGGELVLEVGGGGELLAELGGGGELFLELGGGDELLLELGGGAEMLIEARIGGEAELTYEAALELGRAAPQTLAACVIGVNCPESAPATPLHRAYLTWKRPTYGKVAFYRVYRRLVGQLQYDEIGATEGGTATTFVDQEELPDAQQFEYVVRAQFDDGVISRSSNVALITAVNAAPVAVADAAATNEDIAVDIAVLSNDTDADTADPSPATAANEGIKVAAITNVRGGTAVLLADGRVRFTPAPNANNGNTGAGFGFTYRANNGTWSRVPTLLLSPDSNDVTVTVSVASVNDAPAGTDNAVITVKDTPRTFAASEFGFTDPFDTPANALSRVKITSAPAAGTLRLLGGEGSEELTAGAFVTKADIDAGRLLFVPAEGGSGIPYATFTFQVEDDGGTALGGVDLDPSANTMTIHVISFVTTTGANCAPEETPEVTVSGSSVTMGVERGDVSQNSCIHGASALLPALNGGNTKYQVTFRYNLFTWDSYIADLSDRGGDGYWDSFSVSVSGGVPYASLTLKDPLSGPQDLASGTSFNPGFVWGGANFGDGILECNPAAVPCPTSLDSATAQRTEVIPGSAGNNYLNVVLDTKTLPAGNHAHASYGRVRILSIRQVP